MRPLPGPFWKLYYVLCSVFVISILIYDYYRTDSNFYGRLSARNVAIDQALEQIPICTPDDRPRQRALLYALQQWTYYAKKHYFQYWIAYESLIGYVQSHGLLPYHFHIDLLIMPQDTSQFVELSQIDFSSI